MTDGNADDGFFDVLTKGVLPPQFHQNFRKIVMNDNLHPEVTRLGSRSVVLVNARECADFLRMSLENLGKSLSVLLGTNVHTDITGKKLVIKGQFTAKHIKNVLIQ